MSTKEETQERILRAFLDLVIEHGYDGATTRAVAEAAGVNEVTLFRHFGDKETLAREAFTRLGPGPLLAAYDAQIDATDPARAEAGLLACLRFLRDTLHAHPLLLDPGLRELRRRMMQEQQGAAPRAALALLRQALAQAQPALRPEVDAEATAFSLLGAVLLPLVWQRSGWCGAADLNGDRLLSAALRPLIRRESSPA